MTLNLNTLELVTGLIDWSLGKPLMPVFQSNILSKRFVTPGSIQIEKLSCHQHIIIFAFQFFPINYPLPLWYLLISLMSKFPNPNLQEQCPHPLLGHREPSPLGRIQTHLQKSLGECSSYHIIIQNRLRIPQTHFHDVRIMTVTCFTCGRLWTCELNMVLATSTTKHTF